MGGARRGLAGRAVAGRRLTEMRRQRQGQRRSALFVLKRISLLYSFYTHPLTAPLYRTTIFFSRLYSSFLENEESCAAARCGWARAATHLCATISAAAAAWLVRLEQGHPILESPARVLQRGLLSRKG